MQSRMQGLLPTSTTRLASNGQAEADPSESYLVRLAKLERRVLKLERGSLQLESAKPLPPAIANAGPATPLTVEQAAIYAQCSVSHIRSICHKGKLAHIVGPEGEFYTSKEAVDAYKSDVATRQKARGQMLAERFRAGAQVL